MTEAGSAAVLLGAGAGADGSDDVEGVTGLLGGGGGGLDVAGEMPACWVQPARPRLTAIPNAAAAFDAFIDHHRRDGVFIEERAKAPGADGKEVLDEPGAPVRASSALTSVWTPRWSW